MGAAGQNGLNACVSQRTDITGAAVYSLQVVGNYLAIAVGRERVVFYKLILNLQNIHYDHRRKCRNDSRRLSTKPAGHRAHS